MTRNARLVVLGLASAALFSACAGGSTGSFGTGFQGEPLVVRFSDRSVDPAAARVAKGVNVRWINLAQEIHGRVVFPESIASSFSCGPDLAPMFTRIEGGYQSLPIAGVSMGQRVTLPCALAAGSYDYEIWLFGAGFGSESNPLLPQNKLKAKLVVE